MLAAHAPLLRAGAARVSAERWIHWDFREGRPGTPRTGVRTGVRSAMCGSIGARSSAMAGEGQNERASPSAGSELLPPITGQDHVAGRHATRVAGTRRAALFLRVVAIAEHRAGRIFSQRNRTTN